MDERNLKELAETLIHAADEMRVEWEWYAKHIKPRAAEALWMLEQPAERRGRTLCSVAATSANICANAHMHHIISSGTPWFRYKTADNGSAEKYLNWYANASEVTHDYLARCNFYTEMHETVLNRVIFGTGCIFTEEGRDGGLNFRNIPCGTYGFADNEEGQVDTLCRSFKFTAHQAAERFGEDRLPEDVRQALGRGSSAMRDKFEFWHLVTPRRSFHWGSETKERGMMPYLSLYMYGQGEHEILEEGGYAEFPYMVTRFAKWGDILWGYPPARDVLDEIYTSIKTERNMDSLSDLAVYPRLFIDAQMQGETDFRAGGRTVIPREIAGLNLPREWGSAGRIDYGKERLERADEKIKAAFFIPFLQMFSGVDREMTATEARARMSEQVIACSPTFSRFCADMTPMLGRIFALLYRQGAYQTNKGSEPKDLFQLRADGEHTDMRKPRVAYLGRINRAIDDAQQESTDAALNSVSAYVQLTGDTSALDVVDAEKMVRKAFENAGASSDIFRTNEDVQRVRDERAQAAQAQMALQAAQANNQNAQAMRNAAQAR